MANTSTQNPGKDKAKMDAQTEKAPIKTGNGGPVVEHKPAPKTEVEVKNAEPVEKPKYSTAEKLAVLEKAMAAEAPIKALEKQLEAAQLAASSIIEKAREICGTSFRYKGEAYQVRKRTSKENPDAPATFYFVRRDSNLEDIG